MSSLLPLPHPHYLLYSSVTTSLEARPSRESSLRESAKYFPPQLGINKVPPCLPPSSSPLKKLLSTIQPIFLPPSSRYWLGQWEAAKSWTSQSQHSKLSPAPILDPSSRWSLSAFLLGVDNKLPDFSALIGEFAERPCLWLVSPSTC